MRIIINTVERECIGIPLIDISCWGFFVPGIHLYDFSIHAAADYRDKV